MNIPPRTDTLAERFDDAEDFMEVLTSWGIDQEWLCHTDSASEIRFLCAPTCFVLCQRSNQLGLTTGAADILSGIRDGRLTEKDLKPSS